MAYAYIHECRHIDEYRLLGSQVSRDATFSAADRIIPAFIEGCCSADECQHIKPTRLPYSCLDLQNRIDLVNEINIQYDHCVQSIANYNILAEQHHLSPILLAEFEHILIRTYNWTARAEDFANDNGPHFFHDVCLAIATSTLTQVISMILNIDEAAKAMPAPWTGEFFGWYNDISYNSSFPRLRIICPDLADHALKLSYTPKVDYGIAPLPQNYSPFEAVWRSMLKRKQLTQPRHKHFRPQISLDHSHNHSLIS